MPTKITIQKNQSLRILKKLRCGGGGGGHESRFLEAPFVRMLRMRSASLKSYKMQQKTMD